MKYINTFSLYLNKILGIDKISNINNNCIINFWNIKINSKKSICKITNE